MKKHLLLPALILILAAGLRAEDGCGKESDACRPRIKKVTPFMAELGKAQPPPSLRQGAVREASLRQAGPVPQIHRSTRAPAAGTLPAGAPDAPAAEARAPAEERIVSNPAWLLAAAALLAGLYYFLRENRKKGKHK